MLNNKNGISIGDKTITNLSGPVSIYLLKPTKFFFTLLKKDGIKPPIFLFLGDIHQSDTGLCQKCTCSSKNCCVSIDEHSFFKILNPFSTYKNPIHIYTEWFITKKDKELITSTSPEAIIKKEYNITKTLSGPISRIFTRNMACFFHEWKNNPNVLYKNLFNKYCPYSNIQWHHVDLRKTIMNDEDDELGLDIKIRDKYIYEGIIVTIISESDFDNFRSLLSLNPKKASISFMSKILEYGLTRKEGSIIAYSISKLINNPNEFSSYFINWNNELFMSRSILGKQLRKQGSVLQSTDTIIRWLNYLLEYYFSAHKKDWFEKEVIDHKFSSSIAIYNKAKLFLSSFFNLVGDLLNSDKNDFITHPKWNEIYNMLNEISNPKYIKLLLEEIGFAVMCSFVDLTIILRTFKIPINKQTGAKEPSPFLSIAYFGDDHIKSLISLLVNKLNLYEIVPGSIDHTSRVKEGKGYRCLNLSKLNWNLNDLAKEYGIELK
jgi:hypothetical protein